MTDKYEVVVEKIPEDYIPVIRTLRAWKGMGLKEAKFLCQYSKENCPCIFLAGADIESAEDLVRKLRDAGVTASVQASALQNPMIVYPSADRRYELHWFFGPRRRTT